MLYRHTHTHTHTHNGIIAIKKNEILPFETTRTELESIMLSEISQRQTLQVSQIHLCVESKKQILHFEINITYIKYNEI